MTKRVPLRAKDGGIRAYALVDDEDYERIMKDSPWSLGPRGEYATTRRSREGYPLRMHREVLGLVKNDGLTVDHINRDTLDNRKENLRIVTQAQNCQNRGKSPDRFTSRFRGVSFNRGTGKWIVWHRVGGRQFYLGLFVNEIDAAEAAAAFRKEHMPYSVEDVA